jgi:hypothetical protein
MLISLAAVVFVLVVLTGDTAFAQIHRCDSSAEIVLQGATGPHVPLVACPQGDTDSFMQQGWYIRIQVVNSIPIPNIPAWDFWLVDCDNFGGTDAVIPCGGSVSSNADSVTNAEGYTTMSQTTLAASLCGIGLGQSHDGLLVIVQSEWIADPDDCQTPLCLPIRVRSVDLSGDGYISLSDLSLFASGYPPNPYETCTDYNQDGANSLSDLSLFASAP